ncbi:MAG: hypothetical protein L7G94_02725 [Acidilobus sp.]|jgi:hypothetical protein|nr:hypothetical protein [Acidilobus sp.]
MSQGVGKMAKYEFEIVEEYFLNGEHRFRLKLKGTNIIVNVVAETPEEAASRATGILDKVKAYKMLK